MSPHIYFCALKSQETDPRIQIVPNSITMVTDREYELLFANIYELADLIEKTARIWIGRPPAYRLRDLPERVRSTLRNFEDRLEGFYLLESYDIDPKNLSKRELTRYVKHAEELDIPFTL